MNKFNENFKRINKLIKQYKYIYIFSHIYPDNDANYSKQAIIEYIKYNFKNKKICSNLDHLSEALIFVLDTSIAKRCENPDFKKGKYIINIDHHQSSKKMGNLNIVDPSAVSTTEVLAKLFYTDKKKYSKKLYQYLYYGMMSDSNCLSSVTTTPKSLYYASKLAEDGKINIYETNKKLFSKEYKSFINESIIKRKFIMNGNVGYIFIENNNNYDIRYIVDDFKNIKDLKIWLLFVKDKNGLYEGSVRSDKKYVISKICEKYNGGGHNNICAVHSLTYKQCNKLISEIKKVTENK